MRLIFLFLLFSIGTLLYGNNDNFFIIDSIDINKIEKAELDFLEKTLEAFHDADDEISKLAVLKEYVENSYDFEVWPKYNEWMYYYCKARLTEYPNPVLRKELTKFLAGAINNKGYVYGLHGKIIEANDCYQRSLHYFTEIDDKEEMATLYTNIGSVYESQGMIKKAVDCYNRGIELCMQTGKTEGLSALYNNMGVLYKKQGDLNLALDFYKKSLKIFEESEKKESLATTYNNLAVVYDKKGKRSRFLKCMKKSQQLYSELGDKNGLASSSVNMGSFYSHEKNVAKSVSYYDKAIQWYTELDNMAGLSNVYCYMGMLMYAADSLYASRSYAEKALKLAEELGYTFYIEQSADLLSKVEEELGNYKKALEMTELAGVMRDSIYHVEILETAVRNKTKSEFEKAQLIREQEIEDQKLAEEQIVQRRIKLQNMLIFLGILLFFGGIISLDFIKVSPKMAEGLIFIGFLLLFEFILVLFDPAITSITDGLPFYKLLLNTLIVLFIFPIHSLSEKALKRRVVLNIRSRFNYQRVMN